MNIYYEDLNMYENDLKEYVDKVIELLKQQNLSMKLANTILIKSQEILKEKADNTKLSSLD